MSSGLNKNDLLSGVPSIDIQRSRFYKDFKHTTTANSGLLVPFLIDDLLPATTVNFDTAFVCRMLTPLKPVMDDAWISIFWFFTPYRLLWTHWREFYGENTSGPWTQPTTYLLPHIKTTNSLPFLPKGLADHFGFPTNVGGLSVSHMPFRAYSMIWNEFFRNQNTDNPTVNYNGDSDTTAGPSGTDALYGNSLLPVSRMHDYFSDALPTAQKLTHPAGIPWPDYDIPVKTLSSEWAASTFPGTGNPPIKFASSRTTSGWTYQNGSTYSNNVGTFHIPSPSSDTGSNNSLFPTNLAVNLHDIESVNLGAGPNWFDINTLRQAFAIQRYGERLAYGGSRYAEQLQTFYGLTPQDARLQRPEFLGSQTFSINMSQVLQTSATGSSGTPQGNTAAYSLTGGRGCHVSYSTQEHGVLMGLFCIRHDRSYQQGVNRAWSRRELYDFYQPCFANLGNTAILNKEIFANGTSTDDQVFGYQEAWAEYRYLPNVVSGEMRSNYSQSLDVYHYGDYYTSLPTLSTGWMSEGSSEIARTLAITNPQNYDQFLLQFHCNIDTVAPMPLYSVPGLIDHF